MAGAGESGGTYSRPRLVWVPTQVVYSAAQQQTEQRAGGSRRVAMAGAGRLAGIRKNEVQYMQNKRKRKSERQAYNRQCEMAGEYPPVPYIPSIWQV